MNESSEELKCRTIPEIMDADSGTEIAEQDLVIDEFDRRSGMEKSQLEIREMDEQNNNCKPDRTFFIE